MPPKMCLFLLSCVFFLHGVCDVHAQQSEVKWNWTPWRTLPVYDEGRVMPLNTFSRLIVSRICGTNRPHLVLDPILLDTLEDDLMEKFRHERSLAAEEASRIRKRIETLFPEGERTFESYELLFSWLVEPELWEYVPFLNCPRNEFRKEILFLPERNETGQLIRFVAPIQLDRSERYENYLEKLREKEHERTHGASLPAENTEEFRTTPSAEEKLNEKTAKELYQALATYRALVYRTDPYFEVPPVAVVEHLWSARRSFSVAAQSWDRVEHQGMEPPRDAQTIAPRDRMNAIALIFSELVQISDPRENAKISREKIELHLELLLHFIDASVEDSENLLVQLYPEMAKSDEKKPNRPSNPLSDSRQAMRRTDAILFNSSLRSMRRSVQAAYLSLYRTGRTVQVLPALYEDAIRTDAARSADAISSSEFGPWVSLNLVLHAGPRTIRRFVDREFPLESDETQLEQLDFLRNELGRSLSPAMKSQMLQYLQIELSEERKQTFFGTVPPLLQEPDHDFSATIPNSENTTSESETRRTLNETEVRVTVFPSTPQKLNSTQEIRVAFEELLAVYTVNEESPGLRALQWQGSFTHFGEALRTTAERMNETRNTLLSEEQRDEAILRKTAYPARTALDAEFRYYRLDPFFWMGVTAAISVALIALSFLLEFTRKIRSRGDARTKNTVAAPHWVGSFEETLLWSGMVFLLLSIVTIILGGAMRAWISGWAPVTNMYETIVMMCLCAALLSFWFSFQPFLAPPLSQAWETSAFFRKRVRDTIADHAPQRSGPRILIAFARLALIVVTLWSALYLAYNEYADETGLLAAVRHSFTLNDRIDTMVVAVCMLALLWFVPRLILTLLFFPFFCLFPAKLHHWDAEASADANVVRTAVGMEPLPIPKDMSVPGELVPFCAVNINSATKSMKSGVIEKEHDTAPLTPDMPTGSGIFINEPEEPLGDLKRLPKGDASLWLFQARKQVLSRKIFLLIGAVIVLLGAAVTHWNTVDFNPNIRPLQAVLRSNFWLAIHVSAIVVGYASGLIAWLLALTSLGVHIFGWYRLFDHETKGILVLPPKYCDMLAPYVRKMIKFALWMLMIGTILGGRWADYSWGRFWSWDAKEVWALVTIFILLLVLHGRIARLYGEFGVAVGAVFGAIAIVMTWYGFNFVFNVGRHAYGHGDSDWAKYFLLAFTFVNLIWIVVASFRYAAERSLHPQADRTR